MSHDAGDCSDFIEQIVYLLDNELSEADKEKVREHLESCQPCWGRYDVQRTVKKVVARSCAESAPAELRQKIMLSLTRIEITEA
jgi:mycothiol system anti-sigma-R factor